MASKDKLLDSAQKFIDKGQIAKAIGEYQKLVDAFPKEFRYRQKIAELLTRDRRNEEAQPHYEAVAKNYTETGFYLKAIAIYKQMQKVEPNRADLYLHLAELNVKQGLLGNALSEYRSLIAFYEKNKQIRDAVPVLQKMVVLDAENLGVRGKLIETLISCHNDEAAKEQFHGLVAFLDGKGEHGRIIKLYEKFNELCDETSTVQLPLVQALIASDQANKALPILKGLLKQDPEQPEVLKALVDCHDALGNYEDARLTCQHLIRNFPENLPLRERYVRICLALGDNKRALASLEETRAVFSQEGQESLFQELFRSAQGDQTDQADSEESSLGEPFAIVGDTADGAIAEPLQADVTTVEPALPDSPLDIPQKVAAPPPSGLELELDLDLDLGLSPVSVAPQAEPVAAPQAAVEPDVPAKEPVPLGIPQEQELELELEFEELDLDAISTTESHPELDSAAPQEVGERVSEVALENAEVAETIEPSQEPSSLTGSELELDLELDLSSEADSQRHAPLEPESPVVAGQESEVAGETADEHAVDSPAHAFDMPDLEGFEPVMEIATKFSEPEQVVAPEEEDSFATVDDEDSSATRAIPGEDAPEELVFSEEIESLQDSPEDAGVIEELEPIEVLEELEEALEELEVLEELEELETLEEADVEEAEAFADAESVVEEASLVVGESRLLSEEELNHASGAEPVALDNSPAETLSKDVSAVLAEGLEDAEFYLRQGLFDDAERVVNLLQTDFSGHPEVVAKAEEIAVQRQAQQAGPLDGFADIGEDELLGGGEAAAAVGPVIDEFSLEAPLEETEGEDDLQSHFDLGIAYKEMGLLDDAVAEFDRASRDPARRLDCLTLKGQCQLEMGQPVAAESTYRLALDIPMLNDEGRLVLCYELGLLYETLGRRKEALDNYQIVANIDLFFRDVTDKLRDLRQELGVDDQAIEDVSEGGSGRDRISFV